MGVASVGDVNTYDWAIADQFHGRVAELRRLEDWWQEPAASSQGLNMYGRRRVGKSWLFRRFAHGKPAIVLVADQSSPAKQMSNLAEQIGRQVSGPRAEIRDVAELFQVLYQVTQGQQVLVVIDEFPYLLGNTKRDITSSLSSIQAVIEQYRDGSSTKFLICGSTVSQMEDIQSEGNPLHGRFDKMVVQPLPFGETRAFMPTLNVLDQFERYAVAGGMPRDLHLLCSGAWESALTSKVVDSNSTLFNEPVTLLQSELREANIYLAILDSLALKPADIGAIAAGVGIESKRLSPYLENLKNMRLVGRRTPVGADPNARAGQWQCLDHFVRFWFRFVRPYQADLDGGSDPMAHVRGFVRKHLPEHVSVVFEDAARRWARQAYPQAQTFGPWWGSALDAERRKGTRQTEEIDIVGLSGRKVVVAGEVKWTNQPMSFDVLRDLRTFKLPAAYQSGLKSFKDLQFVLVSKSGFNGSLSDAAESDSSVHLVDASRVLEELR